MFNKVILVCSSLMALSCASFSMESDWDRSSTGEHAYRPLNAEPAPPLDDFRLDVAPQIDQERDVRQILGENQPHQVAPLQMAAPLLNDQNDQGGIWISLRRNTRYIVGGLSVITMGSLFLLMGLEFKFGHHRR